MSNQTKATLPELADYFNNTPGATIAETAHHFGMIESYTRRRLVETVKLGLVREELYEERKHQNLVRCRLTNAKLIQMQRAALMRTEMGWGPKKIAEELGHNNRQRAYQILEGAIDLGLLTQEEYDTAPGTAPGIRERQLEKDRLFVEDITKHLLDVDKRKYRELVEAHDLATEESYAIIRRNEDSIEAYMAELPKEDQPHVIQEIGATQFIKMMSGKQLSFIRMKMLAEEYITTDITLKDLAIKYGLATKTHPNPAQIVRNYLDYSVNLKIITQKQKDTKAKEKIRRKKPWLRKKKSSQH
jgi:hypothetical protein